jgi:rhamnosyltransferase
MTDPKVSIILRSYNEGWALKETLPALAAQDYKNWELIVIDSGSTDGSVDMIRKANPKHFEQIASRDYNPSRVMNRGMTLAEGNYCLFLNADATPQEPNWMRELSAALHDPKVAACFGRQIPRPACQAVYACDYDRCFGPKRESKKWRHFFSMVSSGVRRDIWQKRGFLEKLQYAEDHEYTWWAKSQGYEVVYVPDAVVMHSHNYTPEQVYKRSFGDARALAASWDKSPSRFNVVQTLLLGWANDTRRDLAFCLKTNRLTELPYAAKIRWHQRRGILDGFKDGWKHYRILQNETPGHK